MRLLRFFSHGHPLGLLLTFVGFTLSIFGFASLYYFLYKRRRANFSFNSDIRTTQIAEFKTKTSEAMLSIGLAKNILNEAASLVRSGRGSFVRMMAGYPASSWVLLLESGCCCEYVSHAAGGPLGVVGSVEHFSLYDSVGRCIKSTLASGMNEAALMDAVARLEKEQLSLTEQLGTIWTEEPDVWTYWDFFYFSTITQTTVGYGDILPNSTAVRLAVTLQIFIGYVLLILVLNLVLSTT